MGHLDKATCTIIYIVHLTSSHTRQILDRDDAIWYARKTVRTLVSTVFASDEGKVVIDGMACQMPTWIF